MLKKVKTVVIGSCEWVCRKAKKLAVWVVGGTALLVGSDASAALADFVSTDATSGEPSIDASVITNFMKDAVVAAYGSWITLAMIFVIVSIVLWILFKKK
ncbi:hypothetical protein K9K77_03600 [Candidatus Babeliales bacterium]|nr:hypothetical protein [Candidatus Babeliales bacterium]